MAHQVKAGQRGMANGRVSSGAQGWREPGSGWPIQMSVTLQPMSSKGQSGREVIVGMCACIHACVYVSVQL